MTGERKSRHAGRGRHRGRRAGRRANPTSPHLSRNQPWRRSARPRPSCRSTFTRISCWVRDSSLFHQSHSFSMFCKPSFETPSNAFHATHSHSSLAFSFIRLVDVAQENPRKMAGRDSNRAHQAGRCSPAVACCRRGHVDLLQHVYVYLRHPSFFGAAVFHFLSMLDLAASRLPAQISTTTTASRFSPSSKRPKPSSRPAAERVSNPSLVATIQRCSPRGTTFFKRIAKNQSTSPRPRASWSRTCNMKCACSTHFFLLSSESMHHCFCGFYHVNFPIRFLTAARP